ncbi:DUF1653 domain-containing protein [Candidatus Microgenomates bacterium]|nr:DUF1653 domain-containing protein [Candidatus Microgenomates bacterium]
MYPKINKFYRHYKGGLYKVIDIVVHSETLEEMVLYEPQRENKIKLWVRPLKMFMEKVIVNGKKVPRFKLIKEA